MSNPFDDYKDKVNYNYILEAKMDYTLKGGNEDQQIDASEGLEKEVNKLIIDEDYNKIYFKDVELGRVYPKLEEIADTVDMTFGIVISDTNQKVTLQDLKEEIIEYMKNLDSNIDGVSVTGWENEEENVEPTTVYLKGSDKITIEVIKEPKKETVDLSNIDKKLVSEGKLIFKLNENTKSLVLNDDGQIEKYEEEKMKSTYPFAKKVVSSMVNEMLQEGYSLIESEVKTSDGQTIDTDKEKERLEQANKDVDEISQMKKDIEDKVDDLVEESKQPKIFESTDYTKQKLSKNDINEKPIKECLTPEQQNYIIITTGDLDSFIDSFIKMYEEIPVNDDEELISIDDYINFLGGNQ